MGGRKQKIREPKSGIYVIGEGITEQYYFSHIKQIAGFRCIVKPRFFGNTGIAAMRKTIEDLLRSDVFVICVFDADVSLRNESEKKRLEQLQNKYRNHKNLLLCTSLPSIEFWFLLHYLDTSRHFKDAKEAELALRRYLQEYEKAAKFLEKEGWVRKLCADNKLELAIQRARKYTDDAGAYSNVYKAFEVLMMSKGNL
ncbi:MAG: RloB family protein [Prevotellaceae bacterium]|jgi:hypothetical protein|nr:RloB family protein [Prevotellaceae bacterium]